IPLEGLPGLVGRLPGVGPAVKRWAVRRLDRSIGFVALPNRWAGRAVVPELRGVVRPEVLARELAGWLDDEARRAHLRQALEGLRGEPGARSEERRVGKDSISTWQTCNVKKIRI